MRRLSGLLRRRWSRSPPPATPTGSASEDAGDAGGSCSEDAARVRGEAEPHAARVGGEAEPHSPHGHRLPPPAEELAAREPCSHPAPAPLHEGTFYGRLSEVWSVVDIGEDGIELASFIKACYEVAALYDRLGAFLAPAKTDMLAILDLLGGCDAHTLEGAIRHDVQCGLTFAQTQNRKGVSFNILWLVRALRFILALVSNLDPEDATFGAEESKRCAVDAYTKAIKPWHGMLLSNLFSLMMRQVPSREKLVAATAEGRDAAALYRDQRKFVATASPIVEGLHASLRECGLDDPWKA